MNVQEFRQGCEVYEAAFFEFKDKYQLPDKWLVRPDHVAIKCANEADYYATVEEFKQLADSDGLWEIELDGRQLASGRLESGITVAGFTFDWIEIMQPRPGRETDKGFVEHTEFTIDDFTVVMNDLSLRGVPDTETQGNTGHAWINVPIDNKREIKFNDLALVDVTKKERAQKRLRKVK